ncbi:hypothetical protein [Amycolatopsis tolypomycina]|uniref:hypothetical protein n=1 Tax=Amycolatopsis tolypomycina TaxID=208445 RepID=UPI0033A26043
MAYASPAQLATWLGLPPFTGAQAERAQLLLDIATGKIDDETGQSLDLADTVDHLDGSGSDLLVLSRWPVTAVASVTVDGVLLAADEYECETTGLLRRTRGCWALDEDVDVAYTAGYTTAPKSVVGMCLELAAGGWSSLGVKKSERLADYQVAYLREGISLSTADKKALGRYSSNR